MHMHVIVALIQPYIQLYAISTKENRIVYLSLIV